MRFFRHLQSISLRWLITSTAFYAALATAQPAQIPLTSRDGGVVKPNVMLTLDLSSSMRYRYMPEKVARVGTYTFWLPTTTAFDPADPDASGGRQGSIRLTPQDQLERDAGETNLLAAVPTSTNWRQKAMRSADVNTVYYNPRIQYKPWPKPEGGRYPNATPTMALDNPLVYNTTTMSDLTTVIDLVWSDNWCFRTNGATGCGNTNSSVRFDPGLYYVLKRDVAGNPLNPEDEGNYDQYSISTGTTFPKYPQRTDCNASECTLEQERQNFANWFVYYRTRMLLARGAIGEAFHDQRDAYRLGWGDTEKDIASFIDGITGAGNSLQTIRRGVRDLTPQHRTDFLTYIYNQPRGSGTPLLRTLNDVGRYFSFTSNRGPWGESPGNDISTPHLSCRRAYHVMVTDGYWNDGSAPNPAPGNIDSVAGTTVTGTLGRTYRYLPSNPYSDTLSNTLADYAMKYWQTDLRPDLANNVRPTADNPAFWQHMSNYVVGLGVRGLLDPNADLPALTSGAKAWGNDRIDDLWHAALNSRGKYFSATNPNELAQALKNSIDSLVEQDYRESGVATAAPSLEANNRKYIPKYTTGSWTGDVIAYELDAQGVAGAEKWNAASKMPLWTQRNIVTWDRGLTVPAAVPFSSAALSADSLAALNPMTGSLTTPFINFIRGDQSNEGASGAGFRSRKSILGDIVNSNPVLIKGGLDLGYGNLPGLAGSGYPAFLTQKNARTATLFVGANDGMLHAFVDRRSASIPNDDGKEVFAYVPRAVYPNLPSLASTTYGTSELVHRFYVDGALAETDVFVPPPGGGSASWRNYLLGSLGAGGRAVFGLDVTNAPDLNASSVRFEFSNADDADMGHVYAPIQSGMLPNGNWVAIWGNGAFSDAGRAVLFVRNLTTGIVNKVTLDAGSANGLGGVVIQRNPLGQINALYAGDLKGRLWKLRYEPSAASGFVAQDGATPLFQATNGSGVAQPISQAPVLYPHPRGGTLVVLGTGRLFTEADANDTSVQSVYGVWDAPSETIARPLAPTHLVSRSLIPTTTAALGTFFSLSGSNLDWTVHRGWRFDVNVFPSARVVYPLQVLTERLVFVSVVAPVANPVVCDVNTGTGLNLIFSPLTGSNAAYNIFDTNGDGLFNSADGFVSGYVTNADGRDAIVKGTPTCSQGVCTIDISIQNTTGQVKARDLYNQSVPTAPIRDRVWRRIINPPIR